MTIHRLLSLLLVGLGATGVSPAQAPATDWPPEVDPASFPAPTQGAFLLLGGELSDGNYGGWGPREDGALQHVPGRHFQAGSGWWVMACRAEDCRLLPVRLTVEALAHPTYDGPAVPGQRLRLASEDADAAAFLARPAVDPAVGQQRTANDVVILAAFRPDAALRPQAGPLSTAWYAAPRPTSADTPPFAWQLIPPLSRQIRYGNAQVLTLSQQLPDPAAMVDEVALTLDVDGGRQSLGTRYIHAIGETAPVELGEVLQWVGDLDGDGRPDLLINHTGYWWEVALWLSSRAQPGERVGEAARFSYAPPDSPGC
jgi:hypothetical protein